MAQPTDRMYSRTHEWALLAGDVVTVGITQFAQEQLGDVVFVELPAVGAAVAPGKAAGNIESVKAVSEVFSPVAGTVVEVNTALEGHPELINKEPFGEGWLMRVKVVAGATAGLMDAAAYEKFLAEEGH
ncbi:MAG TPA: glycine cleavage system protein GcvH [Thermoanaerobaculaceae bacterium]|nr:glycine cleavage system protein GcvH [Thermoanaerobaculaceae bacterium]HPS79607.1 glycine cleavage system protein GcvH [Thermoanaerobaculaceae bacterium]